MNTAWVCLRTFFAVLLVFTVLNLGRWSNDTDADLDRPHCAPHRVESRLVFRTDWTEVSS